MNSFRKILKKKLKDHNFKSLYNNECNICKKIIKISENIKNNETSIKELSIKSSTSTDYIKDLLEGNFCDPLKTRDLCRYLNIEFSGNCPKLNK